MNSLEEIALKVAPAKSGTLESHKYCFVDDAALVAYARRLVAALGAQEPVAWVNPQDGGLEPYRGGDWISLKRGTKLFAAPVLPSVPEGWMPIETAPKGELVSIWIAGTNKHGERWSDTVGECWLYCYHDSICGQWRTTRPSGHLRCVPERFVTHWMRNPAAPSPQDEAP